MMHFDGRPIEYYLRSYRRHAHLTQKELAYLLGAGTAAKVSRYESGERTPSLESGLAYEAALGRSRSSSAADTRQSSGRWKPGAANSNARNKRGRQSRLS
jgi:transcriptional regulator with XRE-family HTH domain